ncbi:MAG: type 4a pilus biogenesis protein PilO [Candidatus Paceibacterota bacterium]|jgi:Tfp pilus assembly protein PilO|nr:type 4a pilus biogenesis protein PilO [Candidatus Paceibacterota bacterium]
MKEATKQSVSILVITLIFAAVIFVLNRFTLVAFSEYQQNKITIQEKKEALVEIANFKKLAEELDNKYNTLGGDFYKITTAVPMSPNFSELLAILDSIARLTNVTVKDMSFRDVANKKENSDLYSVAEININLMGSYEDLTKFFAETEKELRLMDVINLSLKKTKGLTVVKNKQVVGDFIEANALIEAYYQYHN